MLATQRMGSYHGQDPAGLPFGCKDLLSRVVDPMFRTSLLILLPLQTMIASKEWPFRPTTGHVGRLPRLKASRSSTCRTKNSSMDSLLALTRTT